MRSPHAGSHRIRGGPAVSGVAIDARPGEQGQRLKEDGGRSFSLPSALDLVWFSPASARTVDGRLAWVPIHWGGFDGSLSST